MQGEAAQRAFLIADSNRDGKLSREEWIARYGDDKLFDAYDADGDGVISPAEWLAAQQVEGQFKSMDLDGDGKISREEWIARYGSDLGFDMYDLDGDGVIDADEFIRMKASEMQAAGKLPGGEPTYERVGGPWTCYALLLTSASTFKLVVASGNPPEECNIKGWCSTPANVKTLFEGSCEISDDVSPRLRLEASYVDSTDNGSLLSPRLQSRQKQRHLACEAHIVCVEYEEAHHQGLMMAGEGLQCIEMRGQSYLNAMLICEMHSLDLFSEIKDASAACRDLGPDYDFLQGKWFWFGLVGDQN